MCEVRGPFGKMGFICTCQCHDPKWGMGTSHVAACCACPHHYFMIEDCPMCSPVELSEEI